MPEEAGVSGPTPLLETKFFVPRPRAGQVSRGRLIERLERVSSAKLALISAPPGFGKTSLLAEWLGGAERRVTWVSLDASDNHPPTFWTYVFTALQRVCPGVSATGSVAALEGAAAPPIETLLVPVLNAVSAAAAEAVLVLDDYHVIESPAIHAGMEFLLEHLPPPLHVVVASRADPPFALSRMRVRGQLVELRAADLRFTAGEVADFLRGVMGLALAPEQIAALESRTEGWVAALQLAALSLEGRGDVAGFVDAFAGDDRYVVDYLVEEVLRRQPPEVQEFLLTTSILDRLSASLCEAVSGQPGGKNMLEALERRNLFVVALDNRREWYRYHQLFADVLRAHLVEREPERVSYLHRRASDWYEANGERPLAIRHALAASDFEQAATLIELASPVLRNRRQESIILSWMGALPEEVLQRRPVLSFMYAGALLASGKAEGVAARLDDAEQWIEPGDGGPRAKPATGEMVVVAEKTFRYLPGWIAIDRAWLANIRGDRAATLEQARRALATIPADERVPHGLATALFGIAQWSLGDLELAHRTFAEGMERIRTAGFVPDVLASTLALAEMEADLGRLGEAMATYERALAFAGEQGEPVPSGTADLHVGISEVYRERNELDAARRHLLRSKELGEAASLPEHGWRWYAAMARVMWAEGDLDGAAELLEEGLQFPHSGFFPDTRPMPALNARLLIAQGRTGEAVRWAEGRALTAEDQADYLRSFEHLTLARILLARGQGSGSKDAVRLLGRVLGAAEAGGWAGAIIEALALLALGHQAAGDTKAALAALERALTLAEPEGYARVFLDEGAKMAALLEMAAGRGVSPAYRRHLLSGWGQRGAAARALPAGGMEALSERERDVLRLLATDLSGPEIAGELVVSLNTVRTHTKNVYGKLGVTSRRAAVRRAGELGLL